MMINRIQEFVSFYYIIHVEYAGSVSAIEVNTLNISSFDELLYLVD